MFWKGPGQVGLYELATVISQSIQKYILGNEVFYTYGHRMIWGPLKSPQHADRQTDRQMQSDAYEPTVQFAHVGGLQNYTFQYFVG